MEPKTLLVPAPTCLFPHDIAPSQSGSIASTRKYRSRSESVHRSRSRPTVETENRRQSCNDTVNRKSSQRQRSREGGVIAARSGNSQLTVSGSRGSFAGLGSWADGKEDAYASGMGSFAPKTRKASYVSGLGSFASLALAKITKIIPIIDPRVIHALLGIGVLLIVSGMVTLILGLSAFKSTQPTWIVHDAATFNVTLDATGDCGWKIFAQEGVVHCGDSSKHLDAFFIGDGVFIPAPFEPECRSLFDLLYIGTVRPLARDNGSYYQGQYFVVSIGRFQMRATTCQEFISSLGAIYNQRYLLVLGGIVAALGVMMIVSAILARRKNLEVLKNVNASE